MCAMNVNAITEKVKPFLGCVNRSILYRVQLIDMLSAVKSVKDFMYP